MSSEQAGGAKPSMDEWLRNEFPDKEPAADAGTPAAEPSSPPAESQNAPAGEASPPAGETKPATAAQKRLLRITEYGKDVDVDIDEHFSDETKRAEFAKWIQAGRNHEKAVEFALERQKREMSSWVLDRAAKAGLEYDQTTDSFVQKNRGAAPQTSAQATVPTNGQSTAPTPSLPTDPTQIRKRIAELRPRVLEGEAEAVAEMGDLQIALAESIAAEQTRPLRETFERMKASEELRERQAHEADLAQRAQRLEAVFAKHERLFGGWGQEQKFALVAGLRAQSKTLDEVETRLEAFAQFQQAQFSKMLQQAAAPTNGNGQSKPPAPAAPPVHGGRPPAAGGGSERVMPKSSFDPDWAKQLIPD